MAEEEAKIFKAEIVSKTIVNPSSPTPSHLHHLKLSLLDQLAPPSFYVPILLFYSVSDLRHFDFTQISQTLNSSLSHLLTLYYPFCGTMVNDTSNHNIPYVLCNDENGVVYLEARVPSSLSDLLATRNHPRFRQQILQFLPFDPYDVVVQDECCDRAVMMGVQVSEFACGSVAVGACISHTVCDGATMASFLGAWSEIARKGSAATAPVMGEGCEKFPARAMQLSTTSGMTGEKDTVTRRMVLSGKSVSELRESMCGSEEEEEDGKYTKVEVVTALIWKAAMEAEAEAADASAGGPPESNYASMVTHAVNIRRRMVPPLPDNAIGNVWHLAVSPLVEIERRKEVEMKELAQIVRKSIRKIDGEYVRKLEGKDDEVLKSLKQVMFLVATKGIPCYSFSSWIRFGFYDLQFGWGNPTWVCTLGVPIRNVVVLMPTKCGHGVEAWITLSHLHMPHFENNPHLLRFASFDP